MPEAPENPDTSGTRGREQAVRARRERYARLFWARIVIANGVVLAVVAACTAAGWVLPVVQSDTTMVTHGIIALFACGMALVVARARHLSGELDALAEEPARGVAEDGRIRAFLREAVTLDQEGRATLAHALKIKLTSRLAPIRHVANALVTIGLIGTVIGFMMSLAAIDPEQAADVSAIPALIGGLLNGMATALVTTLVGSILNLWLTFNLRLLEAASIRLYTGALEAVGRRRLAAG